MANNIKKMKLKESFRKAKKIKVNFKSVGRPYTVTREKLVELQETGKLSDVILYSLFEEVPEVGESGKAAKADAAAKAKAAAKDKAANK